MWAPLSSSSSSLPLVGSYRHVAEVTWAPCPRCRRSYACIRARWCSCSCQPRQSPLATSSHHRSVAPRFRPLTSRTTVLPVSPISHSCLTTSVASPTRELGHALQSLALVLASSAYHLDAMAAARLPHASVAFGNLVHPTSSLTTDVTTPTREVGHPLQALMLVHVVRSSAPALTCGEDGITRWRTRSQ